MRVFAGLTGQLPTVARGGAERKKGHGVSTPGKRLLRSSALADDLVSTEGGRRERRVPGPHHFRVRPIKVGIEQRPLPNLRRGLFPSPPGGGERSDAAEGERIGVNSTPTFYINGRPLVGAQPFEAFKQVIDEELARVK